MSQSRRDHTATLLNDGRVLITGGGCYATVNGVFGPFPPATAEIWAP